ncbi:MAG: hypothetical protein N4A62_14635 [Marinisporobacter sp.]|jgi:hypothetical protein|nr:hypothetical protein [Marinisporobacter sp.]
MKKLEWTDEFGRRLDSEVFHIKIKDEKDIRLTILVDYHTYEYIYKNELFNLYHEAIMNPSKDEFAQDQPLEIELKLSPDSIELLALAVSIEEDEVLDYLHEKAANQPENIFINTGAWYVMKVKQKVNLPKELQELGSVKIGFVTNWDKML